MVLTKEQCEEFRRGGVRHSFALRDALDTIDLLEIRLTGAQAKARAAYRDAADALDRLVALEVEAALRGAADECDGEQYHMPPHGKTQEWTRAFNEGCVRCGEKVLALIPTGDPLKSAPVSIGCEMCDSGDVPTNGRHYIFDEAVSATHSHLCKRKRE
jgi:hypothetical protein